MNKTHIAMYITIGKPYAVSEKGRRSNNEDAVYPLPERVHADQKLFLVCDGVGGAEKGEVASALACESIHTFFSSFLEGDPTPDFIQRAIQYTEARFNAYIDEHPEAMGMATTLTLAYIASSGIVWAHAGDSRLYHLRKGEILRRTEDHSLVNLWVRLGKISPEEVATHPVRNVITRAIQGGHEPIEADVEVLTDIQTGDFIFLCTDGVLESMDDAAIAEAFRRSSVVEIKDAIMEACVDKTRDNFSFYIIPIQKVRTETSLKQNILSFLYSFV